MTPTASLLLGATLGLAHAVAGLGIVRLARGASGVHLTTVVLGGTTLRMFAVLAVVVLLLLFSSVQMPPFIAGLGVTFVLGLLIEVVVLLRRPLAVSPRA